MAEGARETSPGRRARGRSGSSRQTRTPPAQWKLGSGSLPPASSEHTTRFPSHRRPARTHQLPMPGLRKHRLVRQSLKGSQAPLVFGFLLSTYIRNPRTTSPRRERVSDPGNTGSCRFYSFCRTASRFPYLLLKLPFPGRYYTSCS